MHRPGDRKECALCRELFLKEDGIWQDSAEFDQLAQGINGGGRQHPAPGGLGGAPTGPPCGLPRGLPAGPPRGPPHGPPAQGPRNTNAGGMDIVRGMGDLNFGDGPQQGGMGSGDFDDGPDPDMGPPDDFRGAGQRLGGGHQFPPMGMFGGGRAMSPFNGGMGYGDPHGSSHRGPFQSGFFDGPNPFR